jgi:hypothetical protein
MEADTIDVVEDAAGGIPELLASSRIAAARYRGDTLSLQGSSLPLLGCGELLPFVSVEHAHDEVLL